MLFIRRNNVSSAALKSGSMALGSMSSGRLPAEIDGDREPAVAERNVRLTPSRIQSLKIGKWQFYNTTKMFRRRFEILCRVTCPSNLLSTYWCTCLRTGNYILIDEIIQEYHEWCADTSWQTIGLKPNRHVWIVLHWLKPFQWARSSFKMMNNDFSQINNQINLN